MKYDNAGICVFYVTLKVFIFLNRSFVKLYSLARMNPLRVFTNLLRCRSRKKIITQYSTEKEIINLDKVLLLNKSSRLDFERLSHPELNEKELKGYIEKKGLDYNRMVSDNKVNEEFTKKVIAAFNKFGITVKSVNRFTCTQKDIDWCDVVIPVGGDGTFLHAARYIPDRNKPVIGLNSDPLRSEGFLCLPKKYSSDILLAIKLLKEGKFKWMFRTRIRINITGNYESPVELHDFKKECLTFSNILRKEKNDPLPNLKKIKQKLPILALNEVFMSELFAAKVSYFEIRLNNIRESVRIKSSGLCVCTGTGSTSWHLSLNNISRQDIQNILKLYLQHTKTRINEDFENSVTNVSNSFNEKLKFGPEEQILGYTIRDCISLGVWPHPKGVIESRGFANTLEVKSRCLDAGIIVDGGVSFPFNDDTVAYLETRPEDALRTVVLLD